MPIKEIKLGTVYFADMNTGEMMPLGEVIDIEPATEPQDDGQIRTFNDTRSFTGELIIDEFCTSYYRFVFGRLAGYSNNWRRLHRKRAIRWRKFK